MRPFQVGDFVFWCRGSVVLLGEIVTIVSSFATIRHLNGAISSLHTDRLSYEQPVWWPDL